MAYENGKERLPGWSEQRSVPIDGVTAQVGVTIASRWGALTGHGLVRVNVLMARSAGPFSREDASAAAGGEAVIAALQGENALLRSEITLLVARIAELERRLGAEQQQQRQSRRPATG